MAKQTITKVHRSRPRPMRKTRRASGVRRRATKRR